MNWWFAGAWVVALWLCGLTAGCRCESDFEFEVRGLSLPPITEAPRADERASDASARVPSRRGQAAPGSRTQEIIPPGSPWRSPEDCLEAVSAGRRRTRPPGSVAIGSWNIRWFPGGVPGTKPKTSPTHVEWLACTIAYLDVAILAAQELTVDPSTQDEWQLLTGTLDRLTGGQWAYRVDGCAGVGRQHVGFLFDQKRVVEKAGMRPIGALNPSGETCGGQLRPGFAGYFAFPGGLDLHLVNVHLKSGVRPADFEKRRASWLGFSALAAELAQENPDVDRIVLGDFNTMGCHECRTAVSREQEITLLSRQAEARGELELRGGVMCTHYYRGRPSLLDHFLVARDVLEVPRARPVEVEGLCRLLACSPLSKPEPRAFRELSDHCPLLLDVLNQDLD